MSVVDFNQLWMWINSCGLKLVMGVVLIMGVALINFGYGYCP